MFESQQKSTGTQYVITVALLAVAFIFVPAVLIVSRPFGYFGISLAIACSTLCAALAWFNWKNNTQVTIPSLETPLERSK
ncbi:MAG TPA: hypothetical protein VN841_09695 [Bryobacteraceae bacterium]|nr:hypothetical protein [Bryobacteraceae bacterium]